jgi:3-methyladenine DNA glycosylase AlkD
MNIVDRIREELKNNASEKIRISSQHFFKEELKCYGLKSPDVNKIGKKYFNEITQVSKDEILKLCNELWQSGYFEESLIACNWSFYIHKHYTPDDFEIFEKWIAKYVSNWASCDTLCNHTVGEFLEMYPDYLPRLKVWAKSENRWLRRASAVSLIIPARKGKFLNSIFELAELLLLDKDDLVQKGYGWLLKAAGQFYQTEVFDYVMQKKTIIPRTALRYAIEKMPDALKKKAMEKYKHLDLEERIQISGHL